EIPQRLCALCRTRQQGREGDGFQRCRRDVAHELRHGTGRLCRRNGAVMATGQTALRFAAHVCPREATAKIWRCDGSVYWPHRRALARQYVEPDLGQYLRHRQTANDDAYL